MAKPKQPIKTDPLIKPLIRVEGQKHILEEVPEENLPEMKAVGYLPVSNGGTRSWVSYVVTLKGRDVLSIEVAEPDQRGIAEDSAKTSFSEQFMDQWVM